MFNFSTGYNLMMFHRRIYMNLKLRLNLIITALLLVVMLVGAFMMIDNAREDVRAEVESTANLALHLLDTEIMHYTSDFGWMQGATANKTSLFRLETLGNIRHLKIEFYDAYGHLRDTNRQNTTQSTLDAPVWFTKFMDIVSNSLKPIRRVVFMNGRVIGEIVITPDPSYEIAEIWNDTLGLLMLVLIFFVIVNVMVYVAVNSALKPVSRLLGALTQLEKGDLQARLPEFTLPEIRDISQKFNSMADALQHSIQSNHKLTQQMIRLQEDERKSLARDLHDEIGQHLTAIHIDASAIRNAKSILQAKASAEAIDTVARQMMNIVHGMLQRLRPGGIEQFGLHVALNELIENWRQRNKGINTGVTIRGNLENIDETVAIAAYRIAQECLTNISKHAKARFVSISVIREGDRIEMTIRDDGAGFNMEIPVSGYGLAGMRERVEGLGGSMGVESKPNEGLALVVTLPCYMKNSFVGNAV